MMNPCPLLSAILLCLVGVCICPTGKLSAETTTDRPNVLFIAVDDLRPELGCYGQAHIHSPNIDRLASRGLRFDRAYCQQAICMSSRASLLSGCRPDTGKIYENLPLSKHLPGVLSINQHFLDNGYQAVSMGKIYHFAEDSRAGWSKPHFAPKNRGGAWVGRGYLSPEAQKIAIDYDTNNPNKKRRGMGPAFEAADVPDSAYPDGAVALHAIEELNRLKDQPFFLAVGFIKPHLPFNAPKKYWDLYDPAQIALAENPFLPQGAPRPALTGWGEMRGYHGIPKKGPASDELAKNLIHGYYACTSYTDALIGQVLDELDRLELADKTVIVLWGDHGWKLGDHGMWCKHTNFEVDCRVPMILCAPGMKARGQSTMALTELVDIYPTLCELCGIELPGHLEGTSMAPLLEDPRRPWKSAAFSQYYRKAEKLMGYTIRTERRRYTEWTNTRDGKLVGKELYDYQTDPRGNTNVIDRPENRELVASLAERLHAGYQAAAPE